MNRWGLEGAIIRAEKRLDEIDAKIKEKQKDINNLEDQWRDAIRHIIMDAIEEVFKPSYHRTDSMFMFGEKRRMELHGKLSEIVKGVVFDTAQEAVAKEIKNQASPEDFIDDIVRRIKSKQLR